MVVRGRYTGQAGLDSLKDITITSATLYDHLEYNGSAWVNTQTPVFPSAWTWLGSSTADWSDAGKTINIIDNNSSALSFKQAGNNYFNIVTLDGSEELTLGGAVHNPDFAFTGSGALRKLGAGKTTLYGGVDVGGDVTMSDGLTVTGEVHLPGKSFIPGGSEYSVGTSTKMLNVSAHYSLVTKVTNAGLQYDLRLTGVYTGTYGTYTITLDNPTSTFTWSATGGGGASGVAFTSTFVELQDGVQIAFSDGGGADVLTAGDQWTFTADPSPTVIFNVNTAVGNISTGGLTMSQSGSDSAVITAGEIDILGDAGNIRIGADGDTDNLFSFNSNSTDLTLSTTHGSNLTITSDGGAISFGNENLSTTGTLAVGNASGQSDKFSVVENSTDWAATLVNLNAGGKGLRIMAANGGGGTNAILQLATSASVPLFTVIENGYVGVGNITPAQKFEIGSADNSKRLSIFHDNSNGYIRSSSGGVYFWPSHADTNVNSSVYALGKGTGSGRLFARSGDGKAQAYLGSNTSGTSEITFGGSAQGLFHIDYAVNTTGVHMYGGAVDNEEPAFNVYGYESGYGKTYLSLTHNSITSTYGSIDFGNENLSTTGQVLIGTGTLDQELVVANTATTMVNVRASSSASWAATVLGTDNGDTAAFFIAYGSTHSTQPNEASYKNNYGALTFYTGTGGAATEKLSISSAGLVTIANDLHVLDNISVGTDSPSGGFSGAGDIYATSGIKAMEGLYSEAVAYGAGLEVADNSQATVYTNVLTPTATLTASTQTIYDPEGDFVTDGVEAGHFLKVITATAGGSPGAYVGATGEIIAVTDATHLVINFGSAGGDTIIDATAMSFVIYPEPRLYISDHGDVHFCVGVHDDASFKVCTDISNNEHAVHFVSKAGVNGNAAVEIEFDPDTHSDCSAIEVNFDGTAFGAADTVGTILDVIIDNVGATAGDIHCMDVALSDTSPSELEVEAIATHEGVDVIGQYLGDPANLDSAFEYDSSGTSYTDRTAAFNGAGTDVAIFDDDNDAILLASTTKFDEINVILDTTASHSIIPTFHYITDAGAWVAFTPADDTDGFTGNGTIRYDSDALTTWGQRTVSEVTGASGAVDYYWVKITRTRNNLVRQPIEDTIQVTALGTKFGWEKHGAVNMKSVAVVDGITEPDTISGQAIIYVDTADGNLKVKFGDGTVTTIATD